MAFTIGAPSRSAQRKHIALAPVDMMSLLFGRTGQRDRARQQRADGERRAATALARLPETYVVFNDFSPAAGRGLSAKWRIDHVVIGPSGVFAIETECLTGRRVDPARVSRDTAAHVKSVQRRAGEFRQALGQWSCGSFSDVFVKPILVYAHDRAYVEKLQEGPVKVIPLRWLATEVTERTFEQLTPDQVYRIAYALFEQLPSAVQQASQPELERLGVIAKAWLAQQTRPQLAAPRSIG